MKPTAIGSVAACVLHAARIVIGAAIGTGGAVALVARGTLIRPTSAVVLQTAVVGGFACI